MYIIICNSYTMGMSALPDIAMHTQAAAAALMLMCISGTAQVPMV